MIPLTLSKERAEYLVRCLRDGKPIEPPPGGWTGNAMLALAGAAFAAAYSQGPQSWHLSTSDVSKMLLEHREHMHETLNQDLHAGIEFYSHLCFAAMDGEWDKQFEREIRCLVTQEGEIKRTVKPVEGFKPTVA